MNQEQHLIMAQGLIQRAEEESSNGGNELIAAEFLWGAFAHCLIIVSLNEGLPHDSHGAFRRIAQNMDATQGSNEWRSRFGAAERLHHHFYHGSLTEDQLRTHRRHTTEGVLEILSAL